MYTWSFSFLSNSCLFIRRAYYVACLCSVNNFAFLALSDLPPFSFPVLSLNEPLAQSSPAGPKSFSSIYICIRLILLSLPYFAEFDSPLPTPICSVFSPDPVSFYVAQRFSIAYLFRLIIRFLSPRSWRYCISIYIECSPIPSPISACYSFESRVKNVTRTISYTETPYFAVCLPLSFPRASHAFPSPCVYMTRLNQPRIPRTGGELCLLRYAAYAT